MPKFVKNYNDSEHSAIGQAPNTVDEKDEQEIIDEARVHTWERMSNRDIHPGDTIRLPNKRGTFEKEGQRYSNDIYTVDTIGRSKLSVKNAEGNAVKKRYRIDDVLIVPKTSKAIETPNVNKAKKKVKVARALMKEGIF